MSDTELTLEFFEAFNALSEARKGQEAQAGHYDPVGAAEKYHRENVAEAADRLAKAVRALVKA